MNLISKLKVRNFKALNNLWSACDALNLCIFACAPTRVLELEKMVELVEFITGWQSSSYEFMKWGERRNTLMRIYNLREGINKADDMLPEKFFNEKIKTGRFKGIRLNKNDFNEVINLYYKMMGWDCDGIPTESLLYDQHIEWTIPIINKLKRNNKNKIK
jgi:aldehyde:ferredoxin oxidoreductase